MRIVYVIRDTCTADAARMLRGGGGRPCGVQTAVGNFRTTALASPPTPQTVFYRSDEFRVAFSPRFAEHVTERSSFIRVLDSTIRTRRDYVLRFTPKLDAGVGAKNIYRNIFFYF